MTGDSATVEPVPQSFATAVAAVDAAHPFGPSFFLTQLAGLVRDHCPARGELPSVDLHLQGGDVLHVCHIIGLGLSWVVLAIRATERDDAMQISVVPYGVIVRVTVRAGEPDATRIGFNGAHQPAILARSDRSAEDLLEKAQAAERRPQGQPGP